MQICSATIRLAGSVQNTVYKTDITPAEILVLQSIHGGDAVIDIVPIETKQRSQHEEWDRLTGLYDRSGGPDTPDGREDVSIVSRLFPGAVKRLPVTLKEIGLEDREAPEQVAPDAEEAIEAPKPRRARKPAEVVAEAPTVAEVAEAEPAPKKGLGGPWMPHGARPSRWGGLKMESTKSNRFRQLSNASQQVRCLTGQSQKRLTRLSRLR